MKTKYIKIICKELNKEFRIYKWENKSFKNFKFPKGFTWAKFSDFIYLHDNDLIKLDTYPIVYLTSSMSKKNKDRGCHLSRVYLNSIGVLGANYYYLALTYDSGRVVCERELKSRIDRVTLIDERGYKEEWLIHQS